MNISEASSGNLYKFMTVLGAILIYVCVSGMTSIINQHDANILAVYEHLLAEGQVNPAHTEAYLRFLESSKKNTQYGIWTLGAGILIGTILSIAGGSLWWFKHQRYEDRRAISHADVKGTRNE